MLQEFNLEYRVQIRRFCYIDHHIRTRISPLGSVSDWGRGGVDNNFDFGSIFDRKSRSIPMMKGLIVQIILRNLPNGENTSTIKSHP